jgi:hypothetical protein
MRATLLFVLALGLALEIPGLQQGEDERPNKHTHQHDLHRTQANATTLVHALSLLSTASAARERIEDSARSIAAPESSYTPIVQRRGWRVAQVCLGARR